jgi:hypothetical protein
MGFLAKNKIVLKHGQNTEIQAQKSQYFFVFVNSLSKSCHTFVPDLGYFSTLLYDSFLVYV